VRIEVEREAADRLSTKRWVFYVSMGMSSQTDIGVVVDDYFEMSRKTRLHKYRADRGYTRLSQGHHPPYEQIPKEEVEVPAYIREEALQKLHDRIKFL
jgi:hypothetical protein